jgi:uncharacterized protein YbaR (Trm112 family)
MNGDVVLCPDCKGIDFEWLEPDSDWSEEEQANGAILICADCGADAPSETPGSQIVN